MYGNPDHADQIRLQLADHIAAHRDYFIHFIVAAGGERRAPRRAAASRYSSSSSSSSVSPAPPSSEDIERSFESKLEGCRKNGTWGGSEDIQAFCQSFKVDVRVYSTKGIQTFRDVYAPGSEERAILHVAFHDFNHYSSVRHVDGPHTGLPRIPNDLKSADRSSKTSPPSYAGAKRSADDSEDEDPRPVVRRKKVRVGAPENKLTMKLRSRSSSRALSPPPASTKRSAHETADEDSRPTLGAKRSADETADEDSRPALGAKRSADESEDEDPRPAVRRKKVRVGAPENKLTMKLRRSSSRALSPSPASTKRSADETADEDPRPALRRKRLRSRISA
ncbi:uncharacterized protein CDV56_105335 [Aspergillus thermomutatus]|uniref:OTU domain-containing protein n=1 Tax=Aspergillus thermomutatus TaxID=41047 RepID=A0A397GM97_ASPTH|nr:uncharacterized protein CDV56_105335 [Aspergillus thermomutatus]RHZ51389.1 hypothetical protein CDV56_105335 [Aspergillus thermomutatus]